MSGLLRVTVTVLALFCGPVFSVAADWPDVDIELTSCQPDGFWAGSKEDLQPKRFWEKQVVDLKRALQTVAFSDLVDECREKFFRPGEEQKSAYTQCVQSYNQAHIAAAKCLQRSKTRCRQHGGSC